MTSMLQHAKWIWNSKNYIDDEYVDFIADVNLTSAKNVYIDISYDGMFALKVNGELAYFNECSDDENNKMFDRFLLDSFLNIGKNILELTVWHHGKGSATYKPAKAGLIFCVHQNNNVLYATDESTLSRLNTKYKNGYCKYITGQLGLSYKYNNTIENNQPFTKSVFIEKSKEFTLRKIAPLVLEGRVETKIKFENNIVTVDMIKETVGFLELDFISEQSQELTIIYGERLDKDNKVPRNLATRDFSVEFTAKKGENKVILPLRRLGGRYIQFEISSQIKINYIGIRPVTYPVKEVAKKFTNPLHQDIYDIASYTLKCCMHAHYEDCPWREQALYALDSRNQMLSGYVAFKEYPFARHSLLLLARGYLTDLKLINLTYPKASELPIPFFSLVYPIQVYEYISNSNDFSLLDEVGSVLDGIMQGFTERIDKNGLIPTFNFPCWNFYEWTDGNDNSWEIGRKSNKEYSLRYDLILNAMYVFAYSFYDKIKGVKTDLTKTVDAIRNTFYNEAKGLFISSTEGGNYSVLANSFAILCGAGDKGLAQKIVSQREKLVDVSLSMIDFFYTALLNSDSSYKDYVIKDIEEKYGYMLSCGATTFWETIKGAQDFDGAGSLCHGWSAICLYWLNKLVGGENER